MTPPGNIREAYHATIATRTSELDVLRRRDTWLGRLRVATFLPALALMYYAGFHAENRTPWLVAAAVLVVSFMVVVRLHEKALRYAEELGQRLQLNEVQLARLNRRWDLVPEYHVEVPHESEHLANDLDLFGHASLYQLISQAHTPFGRETLRDWLLTPATPTEIVERQRGLSFLAPVANVREEIALRARMLGTNDQGTLAFVAWAESPPILAARPWLTWFTRLSSGVMVVILIVALAGLIHASLAFVAVTAMTCLHLAIIVVYGGRVHDVVERVASRSHDIRQYRPMFETIAELPPDVPLFANLHAHMGRAPREPLELLAELTRLVRFARLRRDGIFGIPYYASQLFVLTDFHVLSLMERWKRKHGAAVRRWLEGVGRTEAITSLATLAHDNPSWSKPTVQQMTEPKIVGRELGHPLIAEDARVANDVEIGPPGTFVLVTGSNMSGKSTLLRAVGLNIILAQAGAPVCAAQLRMPPMELATSMRTRDSLEEGVSFFLAELRRLKRIVDQSRTARHNSQLLVYLLDEILQGTNSAERHIAVSRVIGHLLAHGSIGMVSTHDLALAENPALKRACRTVHFRESITGRDGDEKMTFDYFLRPGVAATTNALKLLQFVGLGE